MPQLSCAPAFAGGAPGNAFGSTCLGFGCKSYGDIDYNGIAEQVYVASETAQVMRDLGYEPPSKTYENYTIMGKTFDHTKPEEYINSFAIKR